MIRIRTLGIIAAATLLSASPALAQSGVGMSFRPFFMGAFERFSAETTFDAAFGEHRQVFFGGGLNVVQDEHFYLEVSASKFEKTGQRAFVNNGDIFPLGIPLTISITPLEVTAGYRFHASRRSRIWPYVGGGVGFYKYKETSDFSSEDEDVDEQHAGAILEGGVEVRVHRWVGVAADVHYNYVPGILGTGGVSQLADEKDLGGISARFKVMIGR